MSDRAPGSAASPRSLRAARHGSLAPAAPPRRYRSSVSIIWGLVLSGIGFVLLLAVLAVVAIVAVPLVAVLNRRRASDDR